MSNKHFFIVALLVILLSTSFYLYYIVTHPFPQTEGTIIVEGLSAPVTIRRSNDGIPHIIAASTEELFFAQGFVHAQDRLFNMDVQRRENQEITGALRRTDGKSRILQRIAETDPQLLTILEAYSAGVNAYVATTRRLPVEYQWAKVTWEPWHPEDSLVIAELYAQAVRAADPYHRLWQLEPTETVSERRTVVQVLSFAPATLLNPWYVNQLESPDYRGAGISLMGVPLVVEGTNGEIAWLWQRVAPCPITESPFSVPTVIVPAPLASMDCDVDLESWFTLLIAYNRNKPLPLTEIEQSDSPAQWLDTRMSASAGAEIESLFGQGTPQAVTSLQVSKETTVAEWVELLNSVPSDNIIIQRAQEQLAAWNGEMRSDLPGATLYRVVRAFTLREAVIDEVQNETETNRLVNAMQRVTPDFFSDPYNQTLWDDTRTPETESREDIIARAWEQTHHYLGRRFGDVPHEWEWGRLHYATLRHPLAEQFPILDRLLTRKIPIAGDSTTSIPVPDDITLDFAPAALPALRIILSPGGDFYFAYPGGQSAHPFHPHTNTFLDRWAEGEWVHLEWNAQPQSVLELHPIQQ
jgi:acyl-homoserine lactone acylase PvdQ